MPPWAPRGWLTSWVPTWAARPGSGRSLLPWPARRCCPRWPSTPEAVKGAIGADGQIPYLLAAATHSDSAVIAERLIGAKTNEVPEFAPLLRGLPLGGWVLTIDAAHTVRAHAHSHRRGTARALRDDRPRRTPRACSGG